MTGNEMERNLEAIAKHTDEALNRAMAVGAMALLRDAVMDIPTVPHKEGTLRGSGSVFVEGRLVGTSGSLGLGQGGTPALTMEFRHALGVIQAAVGFNTPYAAYLHEGERMDGTHRVQNWSQPGSGAKYLEKKMAEGKDKYIRIVQRRFERELHALTGIPG